MDNLDFTVYKKRDGKAPKYMGIAALAVFAIAMLFMFNDSWLKNLFSLGGQGKMIAKVSRTDNDIRRRTIKEIAWYSLGKGEEIYENDMVFSGRNSSAAVQFVDGSHFEIDQNSLVIFRSKNGMAELSLKYGKFESQIAAGKSVKIVIGGKSRTISADGNSKIVIEKGATGATELRVLSGALSIDNKIVNSNQKLQILESGKISDIHPVSLDLIKPLNQEKIWMKSGDPLQFAWSESDKTSSYSIKISRSKSLDSPVYETFLRDQTTIDVATLTPGRYYWQVSTTGKERAASETFEFKVFPESAPKPVYPPEGTVFAIENPATAGDKDPTYPVTFVFEDKSRAESFLLEVSTEAEFTSPMISQTLEQTRLDHTPLPSGEYFWRVKVVDSHRVNAEWSPISRFSIKDKLVPLERPVLLSSKTFQYTIPPQNSRPDLYTMTDQEVSAYLRKNLRNVPVIEFSNIELADKYEIQTSDSYLFPTGKIRRFSSSGSKFKIVPFEPGQHFIRVRAVNSLQPFSGHSEIVTAKIWVSPPKTTGPPVVASDKVEERPQVTLQWTPRVFAKNYEVQVSSTDRFEQKEILFSRDTRVNFPAQPEATYFYRVRALDGNRRPISRFSKIDMKKYIIKQAPPPERRLASKDKEKARKRLRSPASLLVPITAKFAHWPQWKLEVGSFSGLADYRTNYADFNLFNEDLNQNKSVYVSGYYAIKPNLLVDAYYEVINGKTAETGDFNTTWAGIGGRYRLWGNLDYGLAAFVGGGFEHAKYFRFGFESDISASLVNRPISLGSLYLTSGLEWRSYFQLRGVLSFSYYQGLFAASDSADTTEFTMTGSNQYAVDATVAHSFTENSYLGIGLRYRLVNYSFSSNEFGETNVGDASTSHLLFRVFVGAEQ